MGKVKKSESYLGKAANFAVGRGKKSKEAGAGDQNSCNLTGDARSNGDVSSLAPNSNGHLVCSSSTTGLHNLGNTCFFNSALQMLLSCGPLQQQVLAASNSSSGGDGSQNSSALGKGPLAYALRQAFVHTADKAPTTKGSSSSSGAYNPQSLLSAVCCHAPQFKGRQQHDSHELLRILVDGLQTEEKRARDLSRRSSSRTGTPAAATAVAAGTQPASNGCSSGVVSDGPVVLSGTPPAAGLAGEQVSTAAAVEGESDDTSSSEQASGACAVADGSNSFAVLANGHNGVEDLELDEGSSAATSSSDSEQSQLQQPNGVISSSQQQQLGEGAARELGRSSSDSSSNASTSSNISDTGACIGCEDIGSSSSSSLSMTFHQANGVGPQPQLGPSAAAAAAALLLPAAAANGDAAAAGAAPVGSSLPDAAAGAPPPSSSGPLARKSLLPPTPPRSAGDTLVDAVFGGVLVSQVACAACQYVSVNYEPFLDLSLSIPGQEGGPLVLKRKASLLERLTGRGSTSTGSSSGKDTGEGGKGQQGAAEDGKGGKPKKLTPKERRKLAAEAKKQAKWQKQQDKLRRKQQQQQQQQQEEEEGHGQTTAEAPAAAVSPAQEPVRLAAQEQLLADADDGTSSTGADSSTMTGPLPAPSQPAQQQPPPALEPVAVPMGCFPLGGLGGGTSPGGSLTPNKPLHRRWGSLGSLSALTGALRGRHSRQSSKEVVGLDAPAGAGVGEGVVGVSPTGSGALPADLARVAADLARVSVRSNGSGSNSTLHGAPSLDAINDTACIPEGDEEAAAAGESLQHSSSGRRRAAAAPGSAAAAVGGGGGSGPGPQAQGQGAAAHQLGMSAAGSGAVHSPFASAAHQAAPFQQMQGSTAATPTAAPAAPAAAVGEGGGADGSTNGTAPAATPAAAAAGALSPGPLGDVGPLTVRASELTISHCLTGFFMPEVITWCCPKEKAELKAAAEAEEAAAGAPATPPPAAAASSSQEPAVQQPTAACAIPVASPLPLSPTQGSTPLSSSLLKRVSFSGGGPEVHLVPGSVEQRGTTLSSALAGRAPFTRPISWEGAALLLTAKLGDAAVVGAGRQQQRLGLALAGAGEVNTRALEVLPGGRPLVLGEVELPPEVQALQGEAQGHLTQGLALLLLDCLADIMQQEGGIPGLQAMTAGGLQLLPLHPGSRLSWHAELEEDEVDRYWKVRGHVPPASHAAGGDGAGAGACAGSEREVVGGEYWEYPAEPAGPTTATAGAAGGAQTGPTAAAAAGQSLLAASKQVARALDLSAAVEPAAAEGGAADEDEGLFDMEREPAPPAAAAGAGDLGRTSSTSAESNSSGGSAEAAAGGSGRAFRRVPYHADVTHTQQQQQQPDDEGGEPQQQLAVDGCSTSAQPVAIPAAGSRGAAAAAATLPTSNGCLPQQPAAAGGKSAAPAASKESSTPAGGAGAAGPHAAATGAATTPQPVAVGTPGSARRSSLARRSISRQARKGYRLYLAPQVLVLHLKRFQQDSKGRLSKLDTPVKFDFQLDLTPFMAADSPDLRPPPPPPAQQQQGAVPGEGSAAAWEGGQQGEGEGSISGNSSTAESSSSSRRPGVCYDLVGLVVHMGSMKSGHYVAYVKRAILEPDTSSSGTSSNGAASAAPQAAAAAAGTTGSSSGSNPGSSSGSGAGILSSAFNKASRALGGGGGAPGAAGAAAAVREQWYHISDCTVKPVSRSEVAAAQAYMLMYVRC